SDVLRLRLGELSKAEARTQMRLSRLRNAIDSNLKSGIPEFTPSFLASYGNMAEFQQLHSALLAVQGSTAQMKSGLTERFNKILSDIIARLESHAHEVSGSDGNAPPIAPPSKPQPVPQAEEGIYASTLTHSEVDER